MELKSLFIGLVMAIAVFAVKAGIGWRYAISGRRVGKLSLSLGILVAYGILFGAIYYLVTTIDLLRHYETFEPLWRNAMLLHWIMAASIFVWAIFLLRRSNGSSAERMGDCCSSAQAWWALVIPCPVCLGVLLLSQSVLVLYFPEQSFWATVGLFFAFVAIALASAAATHIGSLGRRSSPQGGLGMAMLITSSYFMLFALLAPGFAEAGRAYRIASYSQEKSDFDPWTLIATLTIVTFFLLIGFVHFYRKRRIST